MAPVEEPEEMPLPSDPKVIFLGGLFAIALLTAIYVAAEIVMPLVLALVLSLLLQPAMRLLERWHLPRTLAALLLILAVVGTIVGLGAAISGPASTWADKLPEGIPRLQERLNFMQAPINTLQRFLQQVDGLGQPAGAPAAVSAEGSTLMTKIFTGTRYFASGFFTTILFLFFLLVSGDTFLRRLVEILPSFQQQAPGGRNLTTNRKRYLRVSGYDYAHERRSRCCHGRGYVAHGDRQPDSLGGSCFPAELRADPWAHSRRGDLSPRWPFVY